MAQYLNRDPMKKKNKVSSSTQSTQGTYQTVRAVSGDRKPPRKNYMENNDISSSKLRQYIIYKGQNDAIDQNLLNKQISVMSSDVHGVGSDESTGRGPPSVHHEYQEQFANDNSETQKQRIINKMLDEGSSEGQNIQEQIGQVLRTIQLPGKTHDQREIRQKRERDFKQIKEEIMQKNKDTFLFANSSQDEECQMKQKKQLLKQRKSITMEATPLGSTTSLPGINEQMINFDTQTNQESTAHILGHNNSISVQTKMAKVPQDNKENRKIETVSDSLKDQIEKFEQQMNELLQSHKTAFFGHPETQLSSGFKSLSPRRLLNQEIIEQARESTTKTVENVDSQGPPIDIVSSVKDTNNTQRTQGTIESKREQLKTEPQQQRVIKSNKNMPYSTSSRAEPLKAQTQVCSPDLFNRRDLFHNAYENEVDDKSNLKSKRQSSSGRSGDVRGIISMEQEVTLASAAKRSKSREVVDPQFIQQNSKDSSYPSDSFEEQLMKFQKDYSSFMVDVKKKQKKLSNDFQKLQIGGVKSNHSNTRNQQKHLSPPMVSNSLQESEQQTIQTIQVERPIIQPKPQMLVNTPSMQESTSPQHFQQSYTNVSYSRDDPSMHPHMKSNPASSITSSERMVPLFPSPTPHPLMPHPNNGMQSIIVEMPEEQRNSIHNSQLRQSTGQSQQQSHPEFMLYKDPTPSSNLYASSQSMPNLILSQQVPSSPNRSNAEVFSDLLAQVLSFQESVLLNDLNDTTSCGLLSTFDSTLAQQLPLLSRDTRSFKEIAIVLQQQLQFMQTINGQMKSHYKECLGQLHQSSVVEDKVVYSRSRDTLGRINTDMDQSQFTYDFDSNRSAFFNAGGQTAPTRSGGLCQHCKKMTFQAEERLKQIQDYADELKELRGQNLELNDQNKNFNISLQNLDEKCQNLEDNNNQLIGKLKFAMNHAKTIQDEFLKQQDEVNQQSSNFKTQHEILANKMKQIQRKLAMEVQKQLKNLQNENKNVQGQLEEAQAKLKESEKIKAEISQTSQNLIQGKEHENKIIQLEIRKLKYTLAQTIQNEQQIRNELQTQVESVKILEQQAQSQLIIERQAKENLCIQAQQLEDKLFNLDVANKSLQHELMTMKENQKKKERSRPLSSSQRIEKQTSDDSATTKAISELNQQQFVNRIKVYRENGCQVNIIPPAKKVKDAQTDMVENRFNSDAYSLKNFLVQNVPTQQSHRVQLKNSHRSDPQNNLQSNTAKIPDAVIQDVKQYYVDNVVKQHAQTVLIDKLTKQVKDLQGVLQKQMEKQKQSININCSSFDYDPANDYKFQTQGQDKHNQSHYGRSKSLKLQSAYASRYLDNQKKKSHSSIGRCQMELQQIGSKKLQGAESTNTLQSEDQSRNGTVLIKVHNSSTFQKQSTHKKRISKTSIDCSNCRVAQQRRGRSLSSQSDNEPAQNQSQIKECIHKERCPDVIEKIKQIDTITQEKSILKIELEQIKKQVEVLKSQESSAVARLHAKLFSSDRSLCDQKRSLDQTIKDLDETKNQLKESHEREIKLENQISSLKDLMEQERRINDKSIKERWQVKVKEFELELDLAKERVRTLIRYLKIEDIIDDSLILTEMIDKIIERIKEKNIDENSKLMHAFQNKLKQAKAVCSGMGSIISGEDVGSLEIMQRDSSQNQERRRERSQGYEIGNNDIDIETFTSRRRYKSQYSCRNKNKIATENRLQKFRGIVSNNQKQIAEGKSLKSNESNEVISPLSNNVQIDSRNMIREDVQQQIQAHRSSIASLDKFESKKNTKRSHHKYRGRDLIDPDRQYLEDQVGSSVAATLKESKVDKDIKRYNSVRSFQAYGGQNVIPKTAVDQIVDTNLSNRQMREPLELEDTTANLTASNNIHDETRTFDTRYLNYGSKFDQSVDFLKKSYNSGDKYANNDQYKINRQAQRIVDREKQNKLLIQSRPNEMHPRQFYLSEDRHADNVPVNQNSIKGSTLHWMDLNNRGSIDPMLSNQQMNEVDKADMEPTRLSKSKDFKNSQIRRNTATNTSSTNALGYLAPRGPKQSENIEEYENAKQKYRQRTHHRQNRSHIPESMIRLNRIAPDCPESHSPLTTVLKPMSKMPSTTSITHRSNINQIVYNPPLQSATSQIKKDCQAFSNKLQMFRMKLQNDEDDAAGTSHKLGKDLYYI